MERRFALFLALTLLIWTGYIALRMYVFPPADPVVAEQVDDAADGKAKGKPDDAKGKLNDEKAKSEDAKSKTAGEEATKGTTGDAASQASEESTTPSSASKPAAPRRRVTIGSLDPKSVYRMLVYIDSRGAAVERVELNSPRYRSIEDYSGYLGSLHLSDPKSGGAQVNVVGPGTPAALAKATGTQGGLQPGDIIVQVDGQPIESSAALERYLQSKTRPDQALQLSVQRKGTKAPITFTTQLIRRPLEVVRPETHTYETPEGTKFLPQDPLSLLISLDKIGSRSLRASESEIAGLPSLERLNWELEQQGPDFAEFSFVLDESALANVDVAGKFKITKRFELAKAPNSNESAYHINLSVSVHNLGKEPQSFGYRLQGPTGLPLEGWWYSTKLHPEVGPGAGARDVAYMQAGSVHHLLGCPKIVSEAKADIAKDEPPLIGLLSGDEAAPVAYAGVDTQFFASVIKPQKNAKDEEIKFRRLDALPVQDVSIVPKNRLKTVNVSVRMTTSATTIQPDKPLVHNYRVFFGPKEPSVLDSYQLGQLIEYGWPIFRYPAQQLQGLLEVLHDRITFGNYGVAIILLTLIVRSCMVPISLRQARSAAKMQELAPEVQRIKDKHPDDPMKQHTAVQELYKKHNFNPFGGCLLVFLQLPIFIGLYRCLSVDIELRDASLIPGIAWASNLAGPDKLFYWKDYVWSMIGDEAAGWLGPYFNVLPLITVTLFLLQQKMFMPPATDEQTKMQQQMMTYMTVFMGVMFYKVPAGLCLYFITSSLWGICERKLLPKAKPRDGGEGVPTSLPAKPASPNGHAKPASTKKKQRQKR